MRDFRDAKAMARTLRAALAAKGFKITIGESLELTAQALGSADWNTLSAAIHAETAAPTVGPAPAQPVGPEPWLRWVKLSADLHATLQRAVASANHRKHQYATLEHLLFVLIDDPDAARVMRACGVDEPALKTRLADYLDTKLSSITVDHDEDAQPTQGFQRVIQRAVIHVRSSGRDDVTGANVLVSIFSERESDAFRFLSEQGLTRAAVVDCLGGRESTSVAS